MVRYLVFAYLKTYLFTFILKDAFPECGILGWKLQHKIENNAALLSGIPFLLLKI
jgi:hypothetical protein